MFQVEYRTSDRQIVGIGTNPDNTFPAGYAPLGGDAIATLQDDSQLATAYDVDVAYLCAGGATIGAAPC